MEDLFSASIQQLAPLADRMRPRTLDEFIGQDQIVGQGRLLRRAIEADRLTSCIFFGPPGCGKTTLASIIAGTTRAAFAKLNAVTSGVADVRTVIHEAEERLKHYSRPTYLLLDECHRWNKSQSDSILPAIERGVIRFIGSTTENPMIAMTPAIVSRCRLFHFERLSQEQVRIAVEHAVNDEERGFGKMNVIVDKDAMNHISSVASGDVRSALNAIELAVLTTAPDEQGVVHITLSIAEESIQQRVLHMDEDVYYDMISAFCKSLRGSDSDAALAWFARMITGGVDPRIIMRRVIVHASEDVGLANPAAMLQAVAAMQALEMIGLPEARIPMTQAIIAICESAKSNSVVGAMGAAFEAAEHAQNIPVPIHLRDTSYAGSKKLGHGKGYRYPHDFPGHYVEQEYMPVDARGQHYYMPSEQGAEARIRQQRIARGKIDPPETGQR